MSKENAEFYSRAGVDILIFDEEDNCYDFENPIGYEAGECDGSCYGCPCNEGEECAIIYEGDK